MTGASNFDICEYIILQLINEYRDTNTMICMLCKTSVARNVFKELKRSNIPFSLYDILEFNATKIFGINASSCVLIIQLSDKPLSLDICNVYDFERPETIKLRFGYLNGKFYSNLDADIEDFDGQCCFEWRQGVPKTWKYLNDNIAAFKNRKSSIYRGAPIFSMFGVGDYSYAKYKVGVSGFYKQPLFSVLYSDDNKPVMTDDTSYFICFESYDMAYVAMLLLNSNKVQRFLTSIAFLDSKRPYTKKVLKRIDFDKIINSLTFDELTKTEQDLNLSCYVTLPMYDAFKSLLGIGQMRFA